ncbi:carboxypeptidase-like regulatory domain-containing protein [Mariniflexile aquimaris]|uniref:Carboxypeptidase-like regulatory domain-containing protein n=1 Tax=Mariniflexile aquimaris TaxID=881009 RepID=A0ABW3BSP8_9FLAO
MIKLYFFFFIFLVSTLGFSQNITAKLIDKNTKNPIPFASIKTGDYSGVITNEEGYFSISDENQESTILNISCLGYKSKSLTIKDLKTLNFIVALDEAFNQLNEIYISNRKPNADSIIARVKRKFSENYNVSLKTYNIFYRATDYIDFENLDFEIDKASHVKKQQLERANSDLDGLSRDIINSKTIHFTDFKANFYTQDKENSKLVITKATKLIDQKNDFSLNQVEKRAQHIVLKYLDTTKTYKVKSGLFKVEDSMSLKNEAIKNKQKNELQLNDLKNSTNNLLYKSQLRENSFLSSILNSNLYQYSLAAIAYYNDEITYIISYKPKKGKAKYTGKLYVNDENYAISKLDYTFFEDRYGSKLNLKLLLGVKYIENLKRGLIIYQKNEDNIYQPKYIKQETGSYFYVNRDLTLIENSKNRNKVSSNFKIEGNGRQKVEILFTSSSTNTQEEFNSIKQEKTAPYQILNKFDKGIWNNEETLEPLEEMKRFNIKK